MLHNILLIGAGIVIGVPLTIGGGYLLLVIAFLGGWVRLPW